MNSLANSTANSSTNPLEGFVLLDRYTANGVRSIDTTQKNALATISAGYRGEDNRVQRTQDGTIFVHGDAPGLSQILAQNDNKRLTITFPSDHLRDFIHQSFREYSASAVKLFGDEKGIIAFDEKTKERVFYEAGTPQYFELVQRCRVNVSVYFTLAEWTKDGADIIFPDGFGLYRLRFTSGNSLHSIVSSLQLLAERTGGNIAGVPFELFLRREERADPSMQKRPVWIWQLVTRPPQGVRLTARVFRAIMENAQQQHQLLQLQAPKPETFEDVLEELDATEGEVIDDAVGAVFDDNTAPTASSYTGDAAHTVPFTHAVPRETGELHTVEQWETIKDLAWRFWGDNWKSSLPAFAGFACKTMTKQQAEGLISRLEAQIQQALSGIKNQSGGDKGYAARLASECDEDGGSDPFDEESPIEGTVVEGEVTTGAAA
jgi:hypothetical protein